MIIIDAGCNRGLFTDKCLVEYPNSKIIMVEANPFLCCLLKEKYEENKNMIIYNNLLADKNRIEYDFYLNKIADTISTASKKWITDSRFKDAYKDYDTIKIKSITLDYLVNTYNPNLIKVDVEGFEYEALLGLNQKSCEICFEWAEENWDNANLAAQHLTNLGYSQFGYIFGDEYLIKPESFSNWENCELHNKINKDRKELWGMIWVK